MSTFTTTTVSAPAVGARLTFSRLKTMVRFNIGGRTDKEDLIALSLNLAQIEVARLHPWRTLQQEFTLPVVVDDSSVTVSGVEPYSVRFTYGSLVSRVEVMRKDTFLYRYRNIEEDASGVPLGCYYQGTTLNFAPRTSVAGDFLVTMLVQPGELVNDTDVSILDTDLVLVNWATAYVLRSLGTPELSQVWDRQFEISYKTACVGHDRGSAIERTTDSSQDRMNNTNTPWLNPFVRY